MSKGLKCCNRNCQVLAAVIIAVILVVLGGCLVYIFDTILINQMKIEEGSAFYSTWELTTVPLYISFYMFNVTNPDEFSNQTPDQYVPPVLEQFGPYVYREYFSKDEIDFLDVDPQQVRYRQKKYLVYQPDMSTGSLDDMITTLDFIAMSIPFMMKYAYEQPGSPFNISDAIKRIITKKVNSFYEENNTTLLFTHSVGELLFGFDDPLLDGIVDLINSLNLTTDPIPYQEFGLYSSSNTSAGWYYSAAYTGNPDYTLTNYLTEYKNKTELDYWWGHQCNMINGTDGTTFPAFMNKERKYVFVGDICRSLYADFESETTVATVPGYLFRVPASVFVSPANSSANLCFCPNEDLSIPYCHYDGGLLLSSCSAGAPIFMTSPHFLYVDDFYMDKVVGMNPNVEEHSTPLVYEPMTGANIKADKRLQVNIFMEPIPGFDITNIIQTTLAFPIFWVNESYEMSLEDGKEMYRYVYQPSETFLILQIVFCIVGGALLLAAIFYEGLKILNKTNSHNTFEDSVEKRSTRFSQSGGDGFNNGAIEKDDVFDTDRTYETIPDKNANSKKNINSTASTSELL